MLQDFYRFVININFLGVIREINQVFEENKGCDPAIVPDAPL